MRIQKSHGKEKQCRLIRMMFDMSSILRYISEIRMKRVLVVHDCYT